MKKLLISIAALLWLMFPVATYAQVFSQNQLIIPPFGSGVIVSTSTANGGKLQASSSPTVGVITATSTTATSSLPHTSVTQLQIDTLSGILKAISGYVQTALVDLTTDVTGILPVPNGGTGVASFTAGSRFVISNGTSAFTSVAAPLTVSNGGTGSTTLTGILKGAGTGIIATAIPGTDYTLITSNTCSAGNHISAITAAGVITCSPDTGAGGTSLSTSTPITGGNVLEYSAAGAGSAFGVATSTLTLGSEFSNTGTLGSDVGGTSGTLSLATNGVGLTKLAQIAGNSILGNKTGATGNVTAFATSTLGIALSDTTGTLSIARGGTNNTSLTTNGVDYFDGTKITNGSNVTYDGTTFQVSGSGLNNTVKVIGSNATSAGLYFQDTAASAQTVFYVDNDRGSFASYGGLLNGGSTNAIGNLFGQSRADHVFLFSDGANSTGLSIGTLTAQPLVFGTNNAEVGRFTSAGNFGVGSTSPGSLLSIGGNGTGTNFFNNATTSKSGTGGYNISSGCYAVNGTCISAGGGGSVTAVTATYPILSSGGTAPVISTAFGTTTNNVYSGTNTFNNGVTTNTLTIGSLAGFLKATAGAVSTALINLASDVTGTLPVANGGTGSTTLTGLLKGNGTGAVQTAVAGTDYQAPISGTTGQNVIISPTNTASATSTIFTSTASKVGIGTTTPASQLVVNTAVNTAGAFAVTNAIGSSTVQAGTLDSVTDTFGVSSSTGQVEFGVDAAGHNWTGGIAPALTSCGTSPVVTGDDNGGTITLGSGTPAACTVTFNKTWTNAPSCNATTEATGVSAFITAISTTAVTFGVTIADGGGKIYYSCQYHHT